MENKNNTIGNIQQIITDNFQQLVDTSISSYKPMLDNMISNVSTFSRSFVNEEGGMNIKMPQFKLQASDDCCTPKNECPPHCIAALTRNAMPGERIIVPFTVKNNCNTAKTYKIGVRDLKDRDGQLASTQPYLNKTSVVLQPGASERILMGIDLANVQSGKTFTTEIVLREKEYNQNICFTLNVIDSEGIAVYPQDEKKYNRRWQSWKSHFYCEPQKMGRISAEQG